MLHFLENADSSILLTNLRELAVRESKVQKFGVYRHSSHGIVLIINGELQHVEAWSFLYHEPVSHLPLAFSKAPHNALVLGGGDFFAARELLRYRTMEEVVMYEHDEELVQVMSEIYPHARAVLEDPRFRLVIGDAKELIQDAGTYDVIINDCFDFINDFREDENIYGVIASNLSPEGVCSDMVYRNVFDMATTTMAIQRMNGFAGRAAGLLFVPEYPGAMHLLTIWGHNRQVSQEVKRSINEEQLAWIGDPGKLRFFDPRNLAYHLYLPPFLRASFPALENKSLLES
ncbi:putative Spermidine synthase [Magnetospirillum sp. LM-5]|uniref:spermine/spermidine synthase domain-containing protein n=1 Tax=Magnetospirillum sp. LM-5 TaxID=2681466 RepID=UPI001380A6F7|nr:hypothetical protein [Magnetospirillum sp. LM-5]CAA7611564.1 putative Spermidine synthase [Magnetospirillum sp. LM-5]